MVAGFDDIPEANWSSHSITSFSESGVSMVEASLDILKQIGEATAQLPVQVVLPVRLIERNSTRRNLPPL
jgi:DNA-binding LacI/PurR family transcriptional regulator